MLKKGEGCSAVPYMDIPRDRLYKRTWRITRGGVFSILFLCVNKVQQGRYTSLWFFR